MKYTFSALAMNEFEGLQLHCDDDQLRTLTDEVAPPAADPLLTREALRAAPLTAAVRRGRTAGSSRTARTPRATRTSRRSACSRG
jgi:hypothetical protein